MVVYTRSSRRRSASVTPCVPCPAAPPAPPAAPQRSIPRQPPVVAPPPRRCSGRTHRAPLRLQLEWQSSRRPRAGAAAAGKGRSSAAGNVGKASSSSAVDAAYAQLVAEACPQLRVPRLRDPRGQLTSVGLSLLFFYQHLDKVKTLSELKAYMAACGRPAEKDPQPRHLGLQHGFRFLVQGSRHPRTGHVLRPGEYCLLCVKRPHESFLGTPRGGDMGRSGGVRKRVAAHHRVCTMTAAAFKQLKARYGSRCAHCGSTEGERHLKNRLALTALQMGHMDPRLPLAPGNCIPLCSLCNRVYKDGVVFNLRGFVRPLASRAMQ